MNNKYIEHDRLLLENMPICERLITAENFRMHWHDFYELEYIFNGRGYHIMNGVRFELYPGSLYIVDPTDFHEIYMTPSMDIFKFRFDENSVSKSVFQTLFPFLQNLNIRFDGKEREIIERLLLTILAENEFSAKFESFPAIQRNLLECILYHVIHYCRKNTALKPTSSSENALIQNVLIYIHRNFRNSSSLAEVAAYAHVSPNYLSKIFHQTIGVTYKNYFNNLRMQFAKKLLLNSSLSITEICYETGYGSLTNFSKEFKNFFSVSPSAFRKQNLNHSQ